jgi:tripartite-type tricarboxylate transporter receptor subunit TctC
MDKRFLLKYLGVSLAAPHTSGALAQQPRPSGPTRLVVPFSPGTTADRLARSFGDGLRTRLSRQFIVENKTGAGGAVGVLSVVNARPDGQTLLLTTASPLVITPFIDKSVSYDVERDLQPVALVGATGLVLVARPNFPARNLAELIQLMKKSPGRYTFASSGNGSYAHVSMELFMQMAGVSATHIPYKTTSQGEVDVMGGQVDLMFDSLASAAELVLGKNLRAYGISSLRPDLLAPGIEPIATQGNVSLAGFEVIGWTGIFAPKQVPAQEIAVLQRAIREVMADVDFRADMVKRGQALVEPSEVGEIAHYLHSDLVKWKALVKSANITAG